MNNFLIFCIIMSHVTIQEFDAKEKTLFLESIERISYKLPTEQ